MLDDETLQALEFDAVLRLTAGFARTPLGKRRVELLRPLADLDQVERLQQKTSEARSWIVHLQPAFAELDDADALWSTLAVEEMTLEPGQILLAADYVQCVQQIRAAMGTIASHYPLLWLVLDATPDLSGWASQVHKAMDREGRVLDAASVELRKIRTGIARLRYQLNEKLEEYFSRSEILQDNYITERNGRYVIPVRAEKKNVIEGVLHGTSSSGATVFLEPLSVVSLNNDLAYLLDQELIEVQRILADLTRGLRSRQHDFRKVVENLADLDGTAAQARLSLQQQAVQPTLGCGANQSIELKQARHPMLIQFLGWENVVPIDLRLEAGTDIVIISGPNAGGKTAVLKTVGLLAVMAQCGFHVPVAEARLPIFKEILADIGDHQSLQESMSTFSSHVLRIQKLLQEAKPETLVLLDELGTATDPTQGGALALATLETLRERGGRVLVTTHLDRLKVFAEEQKFAENVAVEFDEKSMRPTFRLLPGLSGQSNTFSIAARLGMSRAVIDLARSKMGTQEAEAENYLLRLRRQWDELQEERARMQRENEKTAEDHQRFLLEQEQNARRQRQELEVKLLDLELEFQKALQRLLESTRDKMERDRWKNLQMRKARVLRDLFREEAKKAAPGRADDAKPEAAPDPGAYVVVISLGQSGIFLGMEGKQAVVEVAGKRVQVPLSDLKKARESGESARPLPVNVFFTPATKEHPPQELNLIGQTVDEALSRVDKFLDQALLEGYDSVRLIHGRGTGRLAKALRDFLKAHQYVAAVRPADDQEGGAAITIVELR
ncbi:MAG: endonuclease MutS2 [Acidobacteria bacterium]|nr:endonuclease MutS2 [Acidobacteriota bacterium]